MPWWNRSKDDDNGKTDLEKRIQATQDKMEREAAAAAAKNAEEVRIARETARVAEAIRAETRNQAKCEEIRLLLRESLNVKVNVKQLPVEVDGMTFDLRYKTGRFEGGWDHRGGCSCDLRHLVLLGPCGRCGQPAPIFVVASQALGEAKPPYRSCDSMEFGLRGKGMERLVEYRRGSYDACPINKYIEGMENKYPDEVRCDSCHKENFRPEGPPPAGWRGD